MAQNGGSPPNKINSVPGKIIEYWIGLFGVFFVCVLLGYLD